MFDVTHDVFLYFLTLNEITMFLYVPCWNLNYGSLICMENF